MCLPASVCEDQRDEARARAFETYEKDRIAVSARDRGLIEPLQRKIDRNKAIAGA